MKEVNLSGKTTLSVSGSYNESNSDSGSHNTVGKMVLDGTQITLSIPNDPTNTFGSTENTSFGAYAKHGIQGGTWLCEVPAVALSESLVYYYCSDTADTTNAQYTYYTADQLGTALNRQYLAKDTNGRLRVKGQTYGNGVQHGTIYFMNGATVWGMMQVTERTSIKLPTSINNVKLTSWYGDGQTYVLPTTYRSPTPANMNAGDADHADMAPWVELNANGGANTGDVTKLTGVSASAAGEQGNVRATLNGNVITLSGALPSGSTSTIKLTLITDAIEKLEVKNADGTSKAPKEYVDRPVTLDLDVTYFSGDKILTFDNIGDRKLPKGMTLETDSNGLGILRLSNGTKYTLNGSALKVRSDLIKVAGSYQGATYPDTDYSFIEVSVNDSTLRTDADKQLCVQAGHQRPAGQHHRLPGGELD